MRLDRITDSLGKYSETLVDGERRERTRKKYLRDIGMAIRHFDGKADISKQDMLLYKGYLLERYKAATVNSYLISVNKYLRWLGCDELTVKTVRVQRRTGFDDELTHEEYKRLLDAAGNERNYLMLRTLASTGIRVGELCFITREAASTGTAEVHSKGKYRNVFIPRKLSETLVNYCCCSGIETGPIFRGNHRETPIHPSSVWKLMKKTARVAGIDERKAYPHSLRHLFARTYMKKVGNIFELADILGHSSVETTRIYALTSAEEKRESLELLSL